jgi:hypothetical protein
VVLRFYPRSFVRAVEQETRRQKEGKPPKKNKEKVKKEKKSKKEKGKKRKTSAVQGGEKNA